MLTGGAARASRSTRGSFGIGAPGRAALEWSILFAALSLIVPGLGAVSVPFALRARGQGSARWIAALIMAMWCTLLGVYLRYRLGERILP